jgi:hypothetical protein
LAEVIREELPVHVELVESPDKEIIQLVDIARSKVVKIIEHKNALLLVIDNDREKPLLENCHKGRDFNFY